MSEKSFLIRLKKEGKISLVEPSEEIKKSYIEKSGSNLISAKILLQNNQLEEAVSLAYYSMYHYLTALLFKVGIKSENHSASIFLLKEIFHIDNSEIKFAKKERVDKQYYINFRITKEEVVDAIKKSEKFCNDLNDYISRMNNEKINIFREEFVKLFD